MREGIGRRVGKKEWEGEGGREGYRRRERGWRESGQKGEKGVRRMGSRKGEEAGKNGEEGPVRSQMKEASVSKSYLVPYL